MRNTIATLGKSSIAYIARIRFLTSVCSTMIFQCERNCKTHWTKFACVFLFARVNSLMTSPSRSRCRSMATNVAFKSMLARVHAHVSFQLRACDKRIRANRTFECLFLVVTHHMQSQTVLQSEFFATDRTQMRWTINSMRQTNMIGQLTLIKSYKSNERN